VLALLLVGAGFLAGCGPRPRAPAIEDDPVYTNESEGFRFRVPEGWHQSAHAVLPPGRLEKERLLVQYRRSDPGRQATLEVAAADLPPSTDLPAYLSEPAYGAEKWRVVAGPQRVEAGAVEGTRYDLTARVGSDDMTREVVAFRRGERVFFFTALFLSKDPDAREQFRRSLGRLVWK
jgi:hypothetical protein